MWRGGGDGAIRAGGRRARGGPDCDLFPTPWLSRREDTRAGDGARRAGARKGRGRVRAGVFFLFFLFLRRRLHSPPSAWSFPPPFPPLQDHSNKATMAPAPVPETILKRRKRDEQWAADRAAAAETARAKRRAARADAFKRAESYVKEYRAQVRRGWGGGGEREGGGAREAEIGGSIGQTGPAPTLAPPRPLGNSASRRALACVCSVGRSAAAAIGGGGGGWAGAGAGRPPAATPAAAGAPRLAFLVPAPPRPAPSASRDVPRSKT